MARTVAEIREQIIDGAQRPPGPVAGRGDKIFPDRQGGKNLASFGDQPDAAAGNPVRRQGSDRPPVESDLPATGRGKPHNRPDGGRLAHAVAPQQGNHFTFPHREADTEQGLAFSVERLDMVDFQHVSYPCSMRSSPRYAWRTAGSIRMASGGPLAITCP